MANNNQTGQQPGSMEIGDYVLVGKLGEGAMGTVYKARQKSLDRMVALKLLAPQLSTDPQFLERFKKEARASAALNHPNVVQGIDVGEDKGYHYFAMEFLDGETVRARLDREKRISVADVLEIGRQTAIALDCAHSKGLIHRDVKPENLMLMQDGGMMIVKLMDLGLARAIDENLSSTKTGMAIGTPYYMAPEQALGEKHLGPGCDLYALGGTLLHLLTGQPPYDGPNAAIVAAKHLAEPPPNPKALMPTLPAPICAIISCLLAKKPEQRYLSASALAEDIQRVQGGLKPLHIETGKQAPIGTAKSPGAGTGRHPAVGTGKHPPVGTGKQPQIGTGKQPHIGTGKQAHVARKHDDPAGKQQNSLLVPALICAIAVLLGVVGVMVITRRNSSETAKKDTEPVKTDKNEKKDKPNTAIVTSQPNDLEKSQKEMQAAEQERQKRLDQLHSTALNAEKNTPEDLDAQRRAWTELRQSVVDGKLATLADTKLAEISKKRMAQVAGQIKQLTERAQVLAAASDYDGALTLLKKDGAKFTQPEAQELLTTAARQLSEKAEVEGAALLKAAADLEQAGKRAEALAAYTAAAGFRFAPLAAEAAKRADEMKAGADDERMQKDLASLEAFTSAILKMKGLGAQQMFDSARDELTRGLADPKLGARAQKLKIVEDALKGPAELPALITTRLANVGGQGIAIPGAKNVYYKLENGRLHFKPAADFPVMSNKGLDAMKLDELVALSGIKDTQSPQLKSLAPEKLAALGGMLALLGELDAAKALLARGKAGADWDDILRALQNGDKELTAYKAWMNAESLYARRKYKEASAAYKAFAKDFANSVAMAENSAKLQQHLAAADKESKAVAEADAAEREKQADWANAIDLLSLVSLRRDVQVGSWTVSEKRLISDPSPFAKVQLPYQPAEEYDFKIEFARVGGNGDVNQILSRNGKPFVWKMGANRNTLFGFHQIGDQTMEKNPSAARSPNCLTNGRKYTALVKVRNNGVKAYLDDQLISQYQTDYADISAPANDGWTLSDAKSLGLGTWGSPTIFFSIQVLEISGKGTLTAKPKE